MDSGELLPATRRHHDELQVGALRAAVQDLKVDAEFFLEVLDNVGLHIGLRGRGEAQDRRNRVIPRVLADEAPDVPVVGPKVVPPLREAVRLVQHPPPDRPLVEGATKRDAPQLLGRGKDDAGIPEPHVVQGIGALRHGEKPVDGDAGADALSLETRHLIGHEGDQWRDHHRQRPGLVVAGERRHLVAE